MERGEDSAGTEKPDRDKIPDGAALLSGRLADLNSEDIQLINDMIDRLARDRGA